MINYAVIVVIIKQRYKISGKKNFKLTDKFKGTTAILYSTVIIYLPLIAQFYIV